jgi:hypothetical protein
MKRVFYLSFFLGIMLLAFPKSVFSQTITYNDSWGAAGYTILDSRTDNMRINYSVTQFTMGAQEINRETYTTVELPGYFLQNDEGAPNLPGGSRYIAIPNGATAKVSILSMRTETLTGIELAPAPRIPKETEDGLEYRKNDKIYSKNAFYPEKPVQLSEVMQIRGVDMVMLGITPFQYNPITKELVVLRDIEIRIDIEGGNGYVGDDRLRSRWWDPILQDMLLNPEALPEVDYSYMYSNGSRDLTGCEYLIVSPNDAIFQQWADSIRIFRNLQGILTDVVTLAEIGGSTVAILEEYFNDAYNQWDIPPAAVLLLGDYGTNANTSIISPIWDGYCVSDNIFADVDGNSMPDIVFARITANNEDQLQIMVTKFLNYEKNPPTNPGFYDHPITALGWQTDRWFQICSETVGGFLKNVKGKNPVRINAVNDGNPNTDPWSTATNTNTVLNYFGPNGLGYIPASPSTLGGWTGGNATMVNNAINEGSFMLQHRDHGGETGWGEPDYGNSNIPGLVNTDLTFVFSVNCLTGKYNWNQECFAEKFHRYTYNEMNSGALGILAASEVSYSFVNDAFVWGLYDNMWPDFMPSYGTTPSSRGQLPAFGNAAGKYFLQQSSWPYNTSEKEVTYNLFHHHGDAFLALYSEIPQPLTVVHDPVLLSGLSEYTVTANPGSLIALTVDGEIIGVAEGTGEPVAIEIEPQLPPTKMLLTVTRQNFFRYSAEVEVIPPDGPYVVFDSFEINDANGNGNGELDFNETVYLSMTTRNVGIDEAQDVTVTILTSDPDVTVTDGEELFGNILPDEMATMADAFTITASGSIADGHIIYFDMTASDINDSTWNSTFSIKALAPSLEAGNMTISDPTGNGNGRLDPGETADIYISTSNTGHSTAPATAATLSTSHPLLTINSSGFELGDLEAGQNAQAVFNVTVDMGIQTGTAVDLIYQAGSGYYQTSNTYFSKVGLILEDWETGNFEGFNWLFGGNSPWTITDEDPYEGTYCARSGSIANSQSSQIRLVYNVMTPDTISFYRKVSSESGYDFLEFYIDEAKLNEWSGEQGWERVAYPVSAGTHTFKWVYSKDSYVVAGQDRAWIDYVSLPPELVTTAYAGADQNVCEGELIQLNGNGTNVETIQWSTSGNGTFDDAGILNPVYTPGTEDILLGDVTLTITITSPESEVVSDDMNLHFTLKPLVLVGEDVGICTGDVIQFNAAYVEFYTSIYWTTSGEGTFDDPASLTPIYTPGPQDILAGSVRLTLTATNPPCADGSDDMVLTIYPLPTPEISGEASICLLTQGVYSTPDNEGSVFTWTVSGGTIVEGLETHQITVLWDTEGEGLVRVSEVNSTGCETTVEYPVTVNSLPLPAISGPGEVCSGEQEVLYSTPFAEGHSFEWAITGGTYTMGANPNEIVISWGEAGTATIAVTETITETSCMATTQTEVNIKPLPVVFIGNDTSMCHNHTVTFDAGNPDAQSWVWSTGETTQTITVDSSGVGFSGQKELSVIVTGANGCSSGDAITLTIDDCSGIGENAYKLGINIFPNPGKGLFTLELNAEKQDVVNLFILDARGVKVYEENNLELNGQTFVEIDLNGLSEGMYLLTIQGDGVSVAKKLMVQR